MATEFKTKNTKALLIVLALVGGAWLAYRWYENRKAGGTGVSQLGTNLNSIAPALVAGSSGPMSGLQYYAGATNVYVTQPVTQSSSSSSSKSGGGQWPVDFPPGHRPGGHWPIDTTKGGVPPRWLTGGK